MGLATSPLKSRAHAFLCYLIPGTFALYTIQEAHDFAVGYLTAAGNTTFFVRHP
jgi:hypothetical protein